MHSYKKKRDNIVGIVKFPYEEMACSNDMDTNFANFDQTIKQKQKTKHK